MIEILYQDNDIIVCIKPAGLLSEGESEDSLLTVLSAQCGGQVFPVHRLDRGAAGLMVFARNSKAAAGLSRAVQEKQLKKEYFARVSGVPAEKEGEMTDFLFKDSRKGKVFAVKRPRKGVREARLTYRVLWQDGDSSLVRVTLDTGRTHHPGAVFLPGDAPVGRRKVRQPGQRGTGAVLLWAGIPPSQNGKADGMGSQTHGPALGKGQPCRLMRKTTHESGLFLWKGFIADFR